MKYFQNFLKTLLPLFIGFLFIYLSYQSTTPEERQNILDSIQNADYRFVLLSVLFAVLSHFSRAYRWQYLLQPLGYQPRLVNSIFTVMIAYLANLGIPRSGELLRATALSNYEKFAFEKVFGTVVAERAVDLVLLLCFILLSLFLQYELIWDLLKLDEINPLLLLLIGMTTILGIFLLRRLFWQSTHPLVLKIKALFRGFWEGISTLATMKNKGWFVAHTVFIWGMYLAMFYVIKWALPDTYSMTWAMVIPAFVAGGLAISATNGGIGIYPYTVALVLGGFGITQETGLAFGWIMWSSQTLMILFFGALSFFALPLVNSKS
ncbi:MAG: lysylphosphatidylglycerol synthase transmembrane domain-containing protein [Flavobacteriaceae bacterium]